MGLCRPAGYAPRCTPSSDLVRIVAEHLPAFVEHVEQAASLKGATISPGTTSTAAGTTSSNATSVTSYAQSAGSSSSLQAATAMAAKQRAEMRQLFMAQSGETSGNT